MPATVTKLALGSSYPLRILHLEGEEVFRSIKQQKNLLHGLEGDLYKHDHANFSHLQIKFTPHNSTPNGDVRQSSHSQEGFLVFIHNGKEVLECLCGDDVWHIEGCNPKSNAQCLTLQKDTKHYYKAKKNSKGIEQGIFAPCYVGDWSVARGKAIELHKF
jgi:hypothetical protein